MGEPSSQPNGTIDLFQVARMGQALDSALSLGSREPPWDAGQIVRGSSLTWFAATLPGHGLLFISQFHRGTADGSGKSRRKPRRFSFTFRVTRRTAPVQ